MDYKQFENDKDVDEGRKCIALWRTVIVQAFRDALNRRSPLYQITLDYERRVAISWFLDCGRNFRAVCQWAQVDPQKLRDHFIKKYRARLETDERLMKEQKENMEKTSWKKV